MDIEPSYNIKLPLRFVWGVIAQDDGNYFDPNSYGNLKLNSVFNMSHPESQLFLLRFCKKLKKQPFYQPMFGPQLSNCFIENFISWMKRVCLDFHKIDRSPCCETETFPFRSGVFDKCVIDAIGELYASPSTVFIPGVAGPKFSKDQKPTIKAIVIEYESNYTYSLSYKYMHDFVAQVDTWFSEQMKSAPETMKGGWFISDLGFYDLQHTLSQATLFSIFTSMGLSLLVLILSSLNIVTSLFAIFSITCSIIITISLLVLLGWKLNILESIAISTAIGLTVDFSLHYTSNYTLAPSTIAENRKALTKYALGNMLTPISMAALTTGIVGGFMMPSAVLVYTQIGIFLIIVMFVSWLYSTFHLGSLLALAGPENNFGKFTPSTFTHLFFKGTLKSSSNFNIHFPVNSSTSDEHELDVLTSSKLNIKPCISNKIQENFNKCNISEQSPSATSSIIIIINDDN